MVLKQTSPQPRYIKAHCDSSGKHTDVHLNHLPKRAGTIPAA